MDMTFQAPKCKSDYRDLVTYNLPPVEYAPLNIDNRSSVTVSLNQLERDDHAKKVVTAIWNEGVVVLKSSRDSLVSVISISSRRGLVALHDQKISDHKVAQTLIFFPKIEHASNYQRAASRSRIGGPGDRYPGSVGVLDYVIDLKSKSVYLVGLQSSVKHRDSFVEKALEDSSSKNLKNYYAHWKFDLLHIAIDYFRKLDQKVILNKSLESPCIEITDKPISLDLILKADSKLRVAPDLLSESFRGEDYLWQQVYL